MAKPDSSPEPTTAAYEGDGWRMYRATDADATTWVVEPTDGQADATVVFVHGVCEHALRGAALARSLARGNGARRYRVVLFDLPGHGGPDGEEYAWLSDAYCQDTATTLNAVRENYCHSAILHRWRKQQLRSMALERCFERVETIAASVEGPLFLCGHSLGGLIATCVGARGNVQLRGVVLIGPALRPKGRGIEVPLVEASWASRRHVLAWPLRPLMALFAQIGPRVDVRWSSAHVSDLEAECQLHAEDPLMLKQIPLPFLARIERWMSWAQDQAATYPIPFLCHAAADDPIVDTRGAEEFASVAPRERATLVRYDGGCHDLSRSTLGTQLRERTFAWLDEQLRSCGE